MRTDAYSRKLNQAQEAFQVSTFGITARHSSWPQGAGAFVAVRFLRRQAAGTGRRRILDRLGR
jgi:hypothetical protein